MFAFPKNTFQLVLASDGTASYALFLYDDIEWSQADFRVNPLGNGGRGSDGEIGNVGSGETGGSGDSSGIGGSGGSGGIGGSGMTGGGSGDSGGNVDPIRLAFLHVKQSHSIYHTLMHNEAYVFLRGGAIVWGA
jgi:hypothetical protein